MVASIALLAAILGSAACVAKHLLTAI